MCKMGPDLGEMWGDIGRMWGWVGLELVIIMTKLKVGIYIYLLRFCM